MVFSIVILLCDHHHHLSPGTLYFMKLFHVFLKNFYCKAITQKWVHLFRSLWGLNRNGFLGFPTAARSTVPPGQPLRCDLPLRSHFYRRGAPRHSAESLEAGLGSGRGLGLSLVGSRTPGVVVGTSRTGTVPTPGGSSSLVASPPGSGRPPPWYYCLPAPGWSETC